MAGGWQCALVEKAYYYQRLTIVVFDQETERHLSTIVVGPLCRTINGREGPGTCMAAIFSPGGPIVLLQALWVDRFWGRTFHGVTVHLCARPRPPTRSCMHFKAHVEMWNQHKAIPNWSLVAGELPSQKVRVGGLETENETSHDHIWPLSLTTNHNLQKAKQSE